MRMLRFPVWALLSDRTGIVGYIQPRDTEGAAGAANRHQRIEHGRGGFCLGVMAVAAGFKADAIYRAVHFRNLEDLGNLIADGGVLGDVHGFAAETPGLRQPLRDQVTHNHDRRAQQLAGGRAGETDRAGARNINRRSRANARADSAMIARRQNVRQAGQVADLRHGLRLVGEFQQIEIGVRDHDIVGLAAHPAAHIHVAVSCAGPRRIHIQADAGGAFLTVTTPAAGDVKRHGNQVSNLDELDIPAGFDDFAGDLVAQDQAFGRGGAAADHVLVAATNVGGNNFENDAMFAFAIPDRQLRIVDAVNLHDARAHVLYSTVACHTLTSLDFLPAFT